MTAPQADGVPVDSDRVIRHLGQQLGEAQILIAQQAAAIAGLLEERNATAREREAAQGKP